MKQPPHHNSPYQTKAEHLKAGLHDVLEFNNRSASVSMYMFHGGTNFAYMQVNRFWEIIIFATCDKTVSKESPSWSVDCIRMVRQMAHSFMIVTNHDDIAQYVEH